MALYYYYWDDASGYPSGVSWKYLIHFMAFVLLKVRKPTCFPLLSFLSVVYELFWNTVIGCNIKRASGRLDSSSFTRVPIGIAPVNG